VSQENRKENAADIPAPSKKDVEFEDDLNDENFFNKY